MNIKFHGVRGSVPAPLTPAQIEQKINDAVWDIVNYLKYENNGMSYDDIKRLTLQDIKHLIAEKLSFPQRSTFGGNTTCVEVRCGDKLFILDMGTGLRELGLSIMQETIANKGIEGIILQSHVHWDHIQGFPFFPQLYMPNKKFRNTFMFFGGKEWDKSLEDALRGQMNPPLFPVNMRELSAVGSHMTFDTVYDEKELWFYGSTSSNREIRVVCRKLNHPQETYGYRIEYNGQAIAFCTDHEPYAALHRPLVELAKDVDIFITDCQYTYHEYAGLKGVPKLGWGHSFPEYIAQVAQEAKPKMIVTTHHDPAASDKHIMEIAAEVEKLSGIKTVAAYEGLVLE